jgi:choline-sulfatase
MPDERSPNVLFLMDDQHRYDYLGCTGAGFVRTPNLDALSRRGMLFRQCFTSYPMCGPARVALATGRSPIRYGPAINPILPLSAPTFYQRFRDQGYRVGCIGKIDLAKPDKYNGRNGDRPCTYSYGFTHPFECEGKLHAAEGEPKKTLGPYGGYLEEKNLFGRFQEDYVARKKAGGIHRASHDSILTADDYEDGFIGRKACDWLRDIPKDFPWYLLVSFVGPHDPYDPPTEYAERYRKAEMPAKVVGGSGKPGSLSRRRLVEEGEDVAETRRQYCACIEHIDSRIGELLKTLEETGQAENTYIVYTSDHGDMLGDDDTFLKAILYDPAIHVPLMISGPSIPAGRTSDALVDLMDVNQTLLALLDLPELQNTDSRSFAQVAEGLAQEHREFVLSYNYNGQCIRTREEKLIENIGDCAELYDLTTDPLERRNIAEARPENVSRLSARMHDAPYGVKWNI